MDRTNGVIDKALDDLNYEKELEDREYIASFFRNFTPINQYKADEITMDTRLKSSGGNYDTKCLKHKLD